MEFHRIIGIQGLKALTKRECKLGLVHGLLRLMREHTITHRNVCSLSSLKERGTLDIS